jgi:aspartate aminotransferase
MAITLSSRVERVKPSATLAVANRAAELKAAGHDIIDLSVGEPDFDTPDFIKEAAIKAIHEGFTKYTAVDGISSLKKAIIVKFFDENQLDYRPEQIIVSSGAKQCLFNLFTALLNAGDEVIIPAPYWVSYPEMVLLSDGVPVTIATTMQQRFKISAAQLAAAITPKTRLLILNSPSNPSGMAYTRQELAELAAVLLPHPQIYIVTDDIYEHIFWGAEPFVNIVNACPELYERTVVVNGVSKAYAMTGWRIGYAAGPTRLVSAMKKVQSQSTSNPNSIAQKAAQVGISGQQVFVQEMNQEFKRRHDYFVGALNAIPGLECLPADGAFYAFVSAHKLLQNSQIKNDLELAEFFLKVAEVAMVPGSAFGAPDYLRLSFATSMELLQKAVLRIRGAVESL